MKKYLITISTIMAFAHGQAQQSDIYVAANGNMVTFSGAQVAIFGNLINDAIGTAATASTAQPGVNHAGGGTVYLYRHSANGTGSSRIYDGPGATAATDNYNAGGSAVRFFDLVTDNNVGTAAASGTAINTNSGSGQIQFEQEVRVSDLLTFTNGNIWTPRGAWKHAFLHFDADAATYAGAGASNTKYTSPATNMQVDGYVAKTGATNFIFPIGDGVYTRFGGLSSPANGEYKAAYFAKNAKLGTTGISGNVAGAGPMNGGINRVNTTEFWDIDGTAKSQFMLTALNSVAGYSDWGTSANFTGSSAGNIVITGFDAWENLGIAAAPAALTSDGALTTTVATTPDAGNFSAYTWASIDAVLPVKLISFSGFANNCDAIINWTTGTELNSSAFVVQQSADGINFVDMTTVKAAGTGSGKLYSSALPQSASIAYYRLKMVDLDGTVSYSNQIAIHANCTKNDYVKLYPNPAIAGRTVYLSFATAQTGKAALMISDAIGRQLTNRQVMVNPGANILPLDISNYPSGTYFVQLLSVDGQQVISTQKLIKQ